MNVTIVTGNLGSDPRIGQTKNGAEIMSFSVADNQFVRGENRTQWWDVITTNPQIIKTFRASLKKGSFVQVSGSGWSDNETVETKEGNKTYLRRTLTLYDIHYVNGGSRHEDSENKSSVAAAASNKPTPEVDEKAYDIPMGNSSSEGNSAEDFAEDLPF